MKKSSQLYAVWCVCMAHPSLQCNCNGAHWRTQLSILINLAVIRCNIQTKIYEHHHHPYGELEAISFTHCFNISIVRIEVSHITKVKNILIVSTTTHTQTLITHTQNKIWKRHCSFVCIAMPFSLLHIWPLAAQTTHSILLLSILANSNRNVLFSSSFSFSFVPICILSVIERSSIKYFFFRGDRFSAAQIFFLFSNITPNIISLFGYETDFLNWLARISKAMVNQRRAKKDSFGGTGGKILKTKSKHEMLIIFSCPIAIYGTISRKFVSAAVFLLLFRFSAVVVAVFLSWFLVIANQFHIE